MNKVLFLVLFVVSFSVLLGSNNAYAGTEIVFEENFDGTLDEWTESVCNRNEPAGQTCSIGQATTLDSPFFEPPNSLPFWGFAQILDSTGQGLSGSAEVRYQNIFNVDDEDDYLVSAWLGFRHCSGCNMDTNLYIDGNLVFQETGPDVSSILAALDDSSSGINGTSSSKTLASSAPNLQTDPHAIFRETIIHLTPGSHDVEIGMFSNAAFHGTFRAAFDDIIISRDIPVACGEKTVLNSDNECVPDLNLICGTGTFPDFESLMCFGITMQTVGGALLDINTASLLVGAIGTNPVITALVGITLTGVAGQAVWFVHRRRKTK